MKEIGVGFWVGILKDIYKAFLIEQKIGGFGIGIDACARRFPTALLGVKNMLMFKSITACCL